MDKIIPNDTKDPKLMRRKQQSGIQCLKGKKNDSKERYSHVLSNNWLDSDLCMLIDSLAFLYLLSNDLLLCNPFKPRTAVDLKGIQVVTSFSHKHQLTFHNEQDRTSIYSSAASVTAPENSALRNRTNASPI